MIWGPPDDVPGDCNAHLYIADDCGDNHATVRCGEPAGHAGPHREQYRATLGGEVTIFWEHDERESAEEEAHGDAPRADARTARQGRTGGRARQQR